MLGTPGGVPIQQVEFRIVNLPTLLSVRCLSKIAHIYKLIVTAPRWGRLKRLHFALPGISTANCDRADRSSVRQEYGTSPFGEFKPDTLQPQATSMLGLPSGRGGDWSISTNAAKVIPIHMIPSQGLVWVTGCRDDGLPAMDALPSIAESRCPARTIGSLTPASGPTRAVPGTVGSCHNQTFPPSAKLKKGRG